MIEPSQPPRDAARLTTSGRWRALWRRHLGIVLVMMFAGAFLAPTLPVGYYDDDIPCSCATGQMLLGHLGLFDLICKHTVGWIVSDGRIFPIAWVITLSVHHLLVNQPLLYRCFLVALVLVDLLLFYRLLRSWRLPPVRAQGTTLCVVLLLQMRLFHDPVLCYAGLLPLLMTCWLLTLLWLRYYADTRRGIWLVASLWIYGVALTTYEVAYLLLPVMFTMLLAEGRGWRESLRLSERHGMLAIGLVVITLCLRWQAPSLGFHSPYRFRVVPAQAAGVVVNQASAALPLSYSLFVPEARHRLFQESGLLRRGDDWLILALAAALSFFLARRLANEAPSEQCSPRFLLWTGLALWIWPGAALAFSGKYQGLVKPGLGYIPVFVQYFGVALLGAGLLELGRRRWPAHRRTWTAGLVAANACLAPLVFHSNREVCRILTASEENSFRATFAAAFRAGLGDEIPENATVWTLHKARCLTGGPHEAGAIFSQSLGRRVPAVVGEATPGWLANPKRGGGLAAPSFHFAALASDTQHGWAILAPIDPRQFGDALGPVTCRECRVFLSEKFAALADRRGGFAIVSAEETGAGSSAARRANPLAQLETVRRTEEGRLLHAVLSSPTEAKTIRIEIGAAISSEAPAVASRSSSTAVPATPVIR